MRRRRTKNFECILLDPEKLDLYGRWNSQKVKDLVGTPVGNDARENQIDGAEVPLKVHYVGNGLETRSLPCMPVVSRPGGHSDACRSRFERIGADDGSIKAMGGAERDARQSRLSASATRTLPSAAHAAGGSSARVDQYFRRAHHRIQDQRLKRRPVRAAATALSPSAPSKTASWAVPETDVFMQFKHWTRLGRAPRNTTMDEPEEDQEGRIKLVETSAWLGRIGGHSGLCCVYLDVDMCGEIERDDCGRAQSSEGCQCRGGDQPAAVERGWPRQLGLMSAKWLQDHKGVRSDAAGHR